ncbi:MAG: tetratricopeptide repeat protein [Defluviimonas sp.]|nr:tetratricopeptide repeat protein [Paracoccaceae bacterium]MCC0063203.1 tetratricopeptide repeat protein [Defluviimonas sp.]
MASALAPALAPVLALAFGLAGPARGADGVAGPYLAARLASLESDYSDAADFFARALAVDPGNADLMGNLIIALVGRGDVAKAIPVARTMPTSASARSQIADMVVLADLVEREDYEGAIAALESGRTGGQLVDGLFRAWALVGLGRMSDATAAFDEVASGSGLRSFGLYHKALALASAGDFEGADKIFSGDAGGPLKATRRGVIAHAEILSQLERNPSALELIDKTFGAGGGSELEKLRARLKAGETLPFDVVSGARDGEAEVFYTVANALTGETSDISALAYARVAEYLAPANDDFALLSASILTQQKQYDLAIASFDKVPPTSPSYVVAALGRVDALSASDRYDAAIEALQQLSRSNPDRADVWSTLGDAYRRKEKFADAVVAYDNAIANLGADQRGQWPVYYTRGICEERLGKWAEAEADFRRALALSPDQPQVLNYLGYSYLERKENYDEALSLIERAVSARPDDGAIVDSLGWALYRLGRYDESVTQMERAVQLTPVDPVVNDHLGDVFWAVGRKREAEFQWKRALSFEPDTDAEAARIRRKLEVGLDAVLKEEGAEPLAVSKNGG